MENNKNNAPNTDGMRYMPIGMCIGIGVGMAIGAAFGNIGVGMCIGLSVGMGIGMVIDSAKQKKTVDKSESDDNNSVDGGCKNG